MNAASEKSDSGDSGTARYDFAPANQSSLRGTGAELELLESKVSKNMHILSRMKEELVAKAADSSSARLWLQQISSLQSQITRAEIIVGVVGSTGAGKSSMINAVLDEERLL